MFWNNKKSNDNETQDLKAMISGLETERSTLKREVEDLKSKKKIEEEQIKHLVKIKDEKRELEYKKKEMDLKEESRTEIGKIKDEYQDKQIKMLDEAKKDTAKIHSEILARLPNIEAMVEIGNSNKKPK